MTSKSLPDCQAGARPNARNQATGYERSKGRGRPEGRCWDWRGSEPMPTSISHQQVDLLFGGRGGKLARHSVG